MKKLKICYPFFNIENPDYIGGSFESTFQLVNVLPNDVSTEVVFSEDGEQRNRAREHEINSDVFPPNKISSYLYNYLVSKNIIFQLFSRIVLIPYILHLSYFLWRSNVDAVHINDTITIDTWGVAAKISSTPIIWHVRGEYIPANSIKYRLPLVDHIIFVAKSNKQHFESELGREIDCSVVYNGVNTDDYRVEDPANSSLSNRVTDCEKLVGFIGNLEERKRPLLFCKAAMTILNKNTDYNFVIAGVDKDSYNDKIKKMAAKEGKEDSIHILGYFDDIELLLQYIDVVVITSTPQGEAFPRVPLEAMACGTPIVTTDTAGVSEAIIDNTTGKVLGEHPEPEEIGQAIINMMDRVKNSDNIAQACRKQAVEEFDIHITGDQTKQVYYRILCDNGRHSDQE